MQSSESRYIPGVAISASLDSTIRGKPGCPMSPTLFGLLNDHDLQSHDQDAPKLLDTMVFMLLYADGIVLLSNVQQGL